MQGKASFNGLASRPIADEGLQLTRPSVVLHVIATPTPTIIRLNRESVHVKGENLILLREYGNHVSKKDYRCMKTADGAEVWLEDDDEICLATLFADHWKPQMWIEDLDSIQNGLGIYIANGRGRGFHCSSYDLRCLGPIYLKDRRTDVCP